jgi:transposase
LAVRPDACEKCGKERKHHRVTGRPAYACDYCGSMISPMAGTIFEKSSTSLRTWFYAMYLMSATRCGISAKQIQRETGVTYKTAWRMFKQIRTLMSEDISLEGEAVEMDETYVGGKLRKNKHRGKRGCPLEHTQALPYSAWLSAVAACGRYVDTDAKAKTIYRSSHERILPATDRLHGRYPDLQQALRCIRTATIIKRINHSQKIYVMGDVHTNTIEGFWSLLKRGIGGVYHSVSKKYLQTYCDEYSFRYNRRNSDQPMFTSLLEQVSEQAE